MKRFYTAATVSDDGQVLLDGKLVRSPSGNGVQLPYPALAALIAQEWNAQQGEEVDLTSLPLTGIASLALDIAAPRRAELIDELLGYGETDLLFYRETVEEALAEQQRHEWDGWVKRAQADWGTQYALAGGVMPVAQPAANTAIHRAQLEKLDAWQLALLANAVKPSTSLILGWYFTQGALSAAELLRLARLEEAYNEQKWGVDAEAEQKATQQLADLLAAESWRDAM